MITDAHLNTLRRIARGSDDTPLSWSDAAEAAIQTIANLESALAIEKQLSADFLAQRDKWLLKAKQNHPSDAARLLLIAEARLDLYHNHFREIIPNPKLSARQIQARLTSLIESTDSDPEQPIPY